MTAARLCRYRIAAAGMLVLAGPAQAQDIAPTVEALNPLAALETPARDAFIERPLFSPDRRPAAPPAATVETVTTEPAAPVNPEIRLVGVMQTPRERIAQVVGTADQARYSLRVGDYIGPWRVEEIAARSIRMKTDERDVTLQLDAAASPPVTAPLVAQ